MTSELSQRSCNQDTGILLLSSCSAERGRRFVTVCAVPRMDISRGGLSANIRCFMRSAPSLAPWSNSFSNRQGKLHQWSRHVPRKQCEPATMCCTQNDDQWPFMPGVGLMVRVVGLGSLGPEFKSPSAVELIPGRVYSACHPSEVGKMSASLLVSYVGVATRPELYPIANETA